MTQAFDSVAAISRILTEHGPLDEDDVIARIRAEGEDPEKGPGPVINEMLCPARQLTDDRWVWLPTVLLGRVFTHRVRADEVAHDLLTVTPDLDPITELCLHEEYQQLADGSPVSVVLAEYDHELLRQRGIPPEVIDPLGALLLPPGTLSGLGAADSDLVGVRLSVSGLVIERVAAVQSPTDVGERLAATLDADEPTFLDSAVWTVCVDDPAVFTEPLPPLREIIDDCGLVHDDDWLAPPGFDFERWRFERDCERLIRRYGLEPDDALALRTLVAVYDHMSAVLDAAIDADEVPDDSSDAAGDDETPPDDPDGYRALVAAFGSALSDPLLAELLVNETVGRGGAPAALGLFAETLEPQVAHTARVAYRWLRAVALEQTGDVASAEREYLAAESMNTDWPPTLLDLARFASDRGDAERGLALLRRAGAGPDHPLTQILEQHRATPRTDVGRNDACWCGSGRKYKKCHLGHEQLSLDDRVGWLYLKACHHVFLTDWRELLEEAAEARAIHGTADAKLPPGVDDPLLIDTVLFEGGAFADFLAKRGSLLPDDERLLADQWLLVDRSVFEVEQVHRGQGIEVRDVRTGDVLEVRERTASGQLRPGQLICTRVVPAGQTHRFFGGVEPVALHERDRLIDLLDSEPDPVDLVEFLSRRFAPPTLVNTEGDALTMCEATVKVGDSARIEALLDDAFDRADDEPHWIEHVTTNGMQRISATVALEGDQLRVHTNSEQRMDRVLAVLTRLDPSATVLDDVRQPVRDVHEAAELAQQMPTPGAGAFDPDDPQIAEALDGFIREYETAWLDEPIPALDGHTPRQAADDPTRRADLIKLLDSFPVVDGSTGMDADRLRAALGLR